MHIQDRDNDNVQHCIKDMLIRDYVISDHVHAKDASGIALDERTAETIGNKLVEGEYAYCFDSTGKPVDA